MYELGHLEAYLPARKELTTFAVLTIILILLTIVNACVCANNFNRGLKPYINKHKLENQDEKNQYPYTTEMIAGPSGKLPPVPSRMTIDWANLKWLLFVLDWRMLGGGNCITEKEAR